MAGDMSWWDLRQMWGGDVLHVLVGSTLSTAAARRKRSITSWMMSRLMMAVLFLAVDSMQTVPMLHHQDLSCGHFMSPEVLVTAAADEQGARSSAWRCIVPHPHVSCSTWGKAEM